MPAQVVWLKRDLRVRDHRPLFQAAARGPCVCLYVYEPEVYGADDFDPSHLEFINRSLAEVDRSLRGIGGRLTTRVGRMPDVLDELDRAVGVGALWSHQETGGSITYARDRRVAAWARDRGVAWHESTQDGVVRRLKSRDLWAGLWAASMARPEVPMPRRMVSPPGLDHAAIRPADALGLPRSTKAEAQPGGESAAHRILGTFLDHRGLDYPRTVSSPSAARRGCSRLSPHLAWGCISTAQVHRAVRDRRAEADPRWDRALRAFHDRLRWRGHFMQKLESEPAIEHRNFSRAYDGLREGDFDRGRFDAWAAGQTGYPMVDACMRCLLAGGWVNFRMRAMLMSFASYHLWLHWRPTALHLARHFLDYEPGIHYPQAQMQSGTTGINTLRIYSPAKQVVDHDPKGIFIRRYVPELEPVPDEHLAEPHKMPALLQRLIGVEIGRHYPMPIVDHGSAYRLARSRMDAAARGPLAPEEAARVLRRHGGRGRRRA